MQPAHFVSHQPQDELGLEPFESNVHSKSCDDFFHSENPPVGARSLSYTDVTHDESEPDLLPYQSKTFIQIEKQKAPKKDIPVSSKEEYLQEINDRLMREVEEKNALLLQLQENYEHLLLKYAEAQNKIDNLRFRNSINEEVNDEADNKLCMRNLETPHIYSRKTIEKKISRRFTDPETKIDRPATLAVDRSLVKDMLKAVTPTDSEGVDSVVTSMSGHSKIINDLDENNDNTKPSLKPEALENALPVNDPFDKVKHWQNSLPPLDMIETPDTALYDIQSGSPSTKYNELANIPETPEWLGYDKTLSQSGMKKYLRTLSLPCSLTRKNMLSQIYKDKMNHTIDVSSPIVSDRARLSPPQEEPSFPESRILRRKSRPPFLRSSSVPIYDNETPRKTIRCKVPPLDLDDLTLSETSNPSQSHAMTCSPSCLTTHDCSFQTLDSLNTCKATMSDYSLCAIHKSTSITPDTIDGFPKASQEYLNCHVCGEVLVANRSASYHDMQKLDSDAKYSICRSLSCNSGILSPDKGYPGRNNIAAFDLIANELKARSKISMRALAAHVNNS